MLSNIPNKRQVWAWGMYDLANQSFQLLINTLLFSLFFIEVVVRDQARGDKLWSYMTAASFLLTVILSPILGAVGDQRAWKREILISTGVICSLLTAALALLQPGQIPLAFFLYITAAVACGLGENFLGAFLPRISTPETIGRVSAIGWSMSYAGALILLGVTAAYTMLAGRPDPAQARPLFVFAGLWFLGGMIPSILYLQEVDAPQPGPRAIRAAFSRLLASAKDTRRYRQLAIFLAVFFIYSMGTYIIIVFLGIIGASLGFKLPQLILFALVVAATAGVGAILTALYQDRAGHRLTISIFLILWIIATLTMALARSNGPGASGGATPPWIFWMLSGIIGLALGGIGTASRALVGLFTPLSRAAEFFGVFGMVGKLSAIVGVLAFGQLPPGLRLYVTAGFFAAGLLLMRFVDEKSGAAAARADLPRPVTPPPILPA
ncbi:MAG: MFS transporter [Phycisphaerales bacterium]|nr:MFS transporter [Phycisphaerales bacterium]